MSRPTGGKLLEAQPCYVTSLGYLVRLWVVCTYDGGHPAMAPEHCVYVHHSPRLPEAGEHVWWHEDLAYFGDANEMLRKVGESFPAPSMAGEE